MQQSSRNSRADVGKARLGQAGEQTAVSAAAAVAAPPSALLASRGARLCAVLGQAISCTSASWLHLFPGLC